MLMDDYGLTLHHIGVVVANSKYAAKIYQDIFRDNSHVCCEYIQSQDVYVCMIHSKGYAIEFISPASCDSPVSNHLSLGGGLHHLCFETIDIELAAKQLKAELRPITGIFIGYQGRKCGFFWAKKSEIGINLIELIENNGGVISD